MSDITEQSPDGTIRPELQTLLTDANAIQCAKDIANALLAEGGSNDQLDFDFHIEGSTGRMTTTEAYAEKNVWFKFDTKRFTTLDKVKKAEFKANMNVEENLLIERFHRKVCDALVSNYAQEVEKALKQYMFGGKDAPLKLRQATALDMADFSNMRPEENVQILIEKNVPRSEMDQSHGVSQDLFKTAMATGKDYNKIVQEKKAAGDPLYKYVEKVHVRKYAWEVQIDLFVDFSSPKALGQ